MPSTRLLSGLALLAVLGLASCGGGGSNSTSTSAAQNPAAPTPAQFPKADPATFRRLAKSIPAGGPVLALSVADLQPGTNRLGFGLFDRSRKQINGASAAVYVQAQSGGKVYGPYPARDESLGVKSAYLSTTVAKDPDAAKSVYVAYAKFPKPGKYNVLGVVRLDNRLVPTGVGVQVRAKDPVPGVGDKPPLINTPTVQSSGGDVSKIDTRTPHDDMHDVNFRDVIGKKPVVLVFATPLLCQSRVCGPVVDIAEEVKHTMPGADKVAFIHMEIYNQNDANKGFRPQVNAFHLPTEPWAFVFGKDGRVAARLEGAYSAAELEKAVQTALKQ
jgi:hypothetical protein